MSIRHYYLPWISVLILFAIPAAASDSAIGVVDGITDQNGQSYLSGWSCTPSNAIPVQVAVFAGGPVGIGRPLTVTTANLEGETTISYFCGTPNHRFLIPLNNFIISSTGNLAGASLYAYGVPLAPQGAGLLTQSGDFNLPLSVPSMPNTCTIQLTQCPMVTAKSFETFFDPNYLPASGLAGCANRLRYWHELCGLSAQDTLTATFEDPSANQTPLTYPGAGPYIPPVNVYMLMGQSNAVGLGQMSTVTDTPMYSEVSQNVGLIQYFDGPGSIPDPTVMPVWGTGTNMIQETTFGPEMGITQTLLQQPGNVVLFKYAIGGSFLAHPNTTITPLYVWGHSGDSAIYPATQSFYDRMLQTFADAFAGPVANGQNVIVRAVFWMQGESDASVRGTAENYADNLEVLVNELHSQLPYPWESPFILGKIALTPWIFSSTVRAAEDKATLALNNTFEIETADLPKIADGAHYNGIGQMILGERMGQMYMTQIH